MMGKAKDLYARVGLSQIPHIISLVDRHRLSPTYGCFDRGFWHYKTAPFPSGMSQEFVLPLALVFKFEFPGGHGYFQQPRLRELVEAGIGFAARSSHRDGSCDDYFPYEKALGAAAFSLYAMTESYLLLELQRPDFLEFFRKRGGWLASHQESGRLSNHQALVVLALYNLFLLTGDQRFEQAARERLGLLLGWQSPEGWFPEYDGCDPGYLTATIDFLAKYELKSKDERVREALERAIDFLDKFVHPDGTCGGEYGSRNTYLFFPHGLELCSRWNPLARQIADRYIRGLERGNRVHLDDDRLCAHLSYDHLQAFLDHGGMSEDREIPAPQSLRHYFTHSRLFVQREGDDHFVVSAAKGGCVSLHRKGRLVYSDSGLVARLSNGKVLVSHLVDDYHVIVGEDGIQVGGHFGEARFHVPGPVSQAFFHLGMCSLGKWKSDLVRRLLQRVLIVGKKRHPMRFRRSFTVSDRVTLVDEVWLPEKGNLKVKELWAGTDHTSIYVAMSRLYRPGCLLPWTDYGFVLPSLNRDGYGRVERVLG